MSHSGSERDICRSTDVTHEPLTQQRHAAVVVELCRQNPRAWMAIYRPNVYVYDDRDHAVSIELENKCTELRLAFQRVTVWDDMKRIVRNLLRYEERRRRISIGVSIDGRIIYGEAI